MTAVFLGEVLDASLVGAVETLVFGVVGALAAGVLRAPLGSGLGAVFGSDLAALLSVLTAGLAGTGLLAALVLLLLGVSALGLAAALLLGSGLVGALTDLLAGLIADLVGVLGIGLEGVLAGALATGLGAGLDTAFAFGLLPGVFADLALVLLCLRVFGTDLATGLGCGFAGFAVDLALVAPLAMGLGADLLGAEAAFCRGLALRVGWVLLGALDFTGALGLVFALPKGLPLLEDLVAALVDVLSWGLVAFSGLVTALLLPAVLLVEALPDGATCPLARDFLTLAVETAAFPARWFLALRRVLCPFEARSVLDPEEDFPAGARAALGLEGDRPVDAREPARPEGDRPFALAAVLVLLKRFTSQ